MIGDNVTIFQNVTLGAKVNGEEYSAPIIGNNVVIGAGSCILGDVYYPLKHHMWLHFIRGNLRNINLILTIVFYERSKRNKISAVCRGWKDAFNVKVKK